MENRLEYRPWDKLMPDTLGLIFKRLPLDEILNVVSSVCKSWAEAVRGPYCWQEIDIEQWSQCRHHDTLVRMIVLLLGRSCGSLREFCVYGLRTELGLSVIGDNAKNLWNLRLPGSEISNSMVEQVAGKLSNLTFLDLSYCNRIGAPAIAALGYHCKHLSHFRRSMQAWECWDLYLRKSQDDEAYAIAKMMPQLTHLELAFLMVTTMGVQMIIDNCHQLESLDIRGCWNVKLDKELLRNRSSLKVVTPREAHAVISDDERAEFIEPEYGFYDGSSRPSWWDYMDIDDGFDGFDWIIDYD